MFLSRSVPFIAGIAAAGGLLLLMGAAQAIQPIKLFTINGPVEVTGIPRPDQLMRVVEGTPFVVPTGKLFVVTGLGSTGHAYAPGPDKRVAISFNGTAVLEAMIYDWQGGGSYGGGGPAVPEVPRGLVAAEGTSVTVADEGTDSGVALGFLADA